MNSAPLMIYVMDPTVKRINARDIDPFWDTESIDETQLCWLMVTIESSTTR